MTFTTVIVVIAGVVVESNNVHDYILSGLQIFLFSLFYVN